MSNYTLSLTNKKVFDFYQNSNIDFENTNILFIEILKKLQLNLDSSFNSNIASQLLDKFSTLSNKVDSLQTNVSSLLNDSLTSYKKDFVTDLKLILTSNNVEQITPLIKESSLHLLERTTNIINELIPKNNSYFQKDIQNNMNILQTSLTTETNKLLNSTLDKRTIDEFLNNITSSVGQSQQTFSSLINSSEQRIESRLTDSNNKMNEMKQIFTENNYSQQILQQNVTEILKKFEKGTGKGNISEHVTYNIILSLFPCAQIDHVGNEQKETGDIILVRPNKPKILIENKDHDSKNVPKHEVDKFIRDCEVQNCCGIMLAQHRGITNKQNFEIQINNGNVLLYVHEVNFDVDKIKTAVEIVENFKIKLDELDVKEDGCVIENELLEYINKEFIQYTNQKYTLLKLVRDFNEKMNASLQELKMPNLEKYLSSRFATSANQIENVCKYCEKFIPKSLLKHYRYCSAKKEFELTNGIQYDSSDHIDDDIDIVIPTEKKRVGKTKK
jgi:hypothetical protein